MIGPRSRALFREKLESESLFLAGLAGQANSTRKPYRIPKDGFSGNYLLFLGYYYKRSK